MNDLWELITTQVRDKAVSIAVAAVFGFLGWYFGAWRALKKWQRREFFERVNISLNVLQNGKLLIRTILEKTGEAIFLNKAAAAALLNAAKNTTLQNPIIPLAQEDYWYYLNSVLNEISEKFAWGQIRRDMGENVRSERYLICLTNEVSGDVRTRKIRVMLIQKEKLKALPEKQPQLESPNHAIRWETLQILAKEYAARPYQFLEIELAV